MSDIKSADARFQEVLDQLRSEEAAENSLSTPSFPANDPFPPDDASEEDERDRVAALAPSDFVRAVYRLIWNMVEGDWLERDAKLMEGKDRLNTVPYHLDGEVIELTHRDLAVMLIGDRLSAWLTREERLRLADRLSFDKNKRGTPPVSEKDWRREMEREIDRRRAGDRRPRTKIARDLVTEGVLTDQELPTLVEWLERSKDRKNSGIREKSRK